MATLDFSGFSPTALYRMVRRMPGGKWIAPALVYLAILAIAVGLSTYIYSTAIRPIAERMVRVGSTPSVSWLAFLSVTALIVSGVANRRLGIHRSATTVTAPDCCRARS
jgi:hypothetical protein